MGPFFFVMLFFCKPKSFYISRVVRLISVPGRGVLPGAQAGCHMSVFSSSPPATTVARGEDNFLFSSLPPCGGSFFFPSMISQSVCKSDSLESCPSLSWFPVCSYAGRCCSEVKSPFFTKSKQKFFFGRSVELVMVKVLLPSITVTVSFESLASSVHVVAAVCCSAAEEEVSSFLFSNKHLEICCCVEATDCGEVVFFSFPEHLDKLCG